MKILVAFLEKDVALAAAQSLHELGWPAPGIVETSDEAVEWINAQGGCDLLLTEVYLSPADGFTLRDTIQPHLPGMRTIFSSGYDISPYVERLEGSPFLARPVDTEALRRCLEELFGAPTDSPVPAPSPVEPVPSEPAPKPTVASVPSVKAAATVSAKTAPAVKAASSPSGPAPASEMLPDDLVGRTIGKFEIEARLAERDGATIYRARQSNVGRLVSLHLLQSDAPPGEAARFLANAKAKARLSHNRVAAVYEAGETDGRCFFTCEHIGAPSLEKFQGAGAKITGTTALETIRMVADVLDTCARQGIPHTPLSAGAILLKPGGLPRMANIACEVPCPGAETSVDMKVLGQTLLQTLDRTTASNAAREVAMRLVQAETSPLTWEQAGALAAEAMPKSKPRDLDKIQAQDIAINRAVDESRKSQRTKMIVGSAISLALTAAACFAIYYGLTASKVNVDDLGALVEIPAGEFDFQGQRLSLPKF
ncbi:MAG: hypothetical protein KGR69_15250, partial [Verrucomicrobia bacterium]|nr:hypothetical protein [Verrucomicrobiota bacterium]